MPLAGSLGLNLVHPRCSELSTYVMRCAPSGGVTRLRHEVANAPQGCVPVFPSSYTRQLAAIIVKVPRYHLCPDTSCRMNCRVIESARPHQCPQDAQ